MRSRVLLVEDDPDDAVLLRRGIEQAATDEFEVVEVHGLQAAMDVLEEHSMDLVLLDLGLPDVASEFGGLERVVTTFPATPVIVVTGEADADEIAPTAALHGAADCVFKDQASMGDLLRTMRVVRNRERFKRHLRRSQEEDVEA